MSARGTYYLFHLAQAIEISFYLGGGFRSISEEVFVVFPRLSRGVHWRMKYVDEYMRT
jgi:hypothetical protein